MKRLLPFIFLLALQISGTNARAKSLQGLSFSIPATTSLNIQQFLFDAARFPKAVFFFQTDTSTGGGEVERIPEERESKNYMWWSIWVVLGVAACMVIYFMIKKNPRKDVD